MFIYAGCVVSCSYCIPNRFADSGLFENSNTGLYLTGQCRQAPLLKGSCV